jgi:hypothetical protein
MFGCGGLPRSGALGDPDDERDDQQDADDRPDEVSVHVVLPSG